MSFFEPYIKEVIATGIVIFITILVRFVISKLIRRFAGSTSIMENRTNLVIKYINLLLNALAFFALIVIWGVQKKDIFLIISSVTTIIGVTLFAQWSILSNITSGVILFFFFPFRIGDKILIHDKDFPVQGEIEDIKAFYIYIKTSKGERITYPNNLLLQKGISIIDDTPETREFMD